MKIILLLACAITVRGDGPFWYPINKFFDDIANKTQEINQFMADQKSIFLTNVQNGTKTVEDIFVDQQKKMELNFNNYEENMKETNAKVLNILKDAHDHLDKNFLEYSKSAPTDVWNLFTKSEQEEKMQSKEAELSTPGIIAASGYPCESHTVVTSDGYILTLHRIPRSNKVGVNSHISRTVLLQHGLFASSADWVFAGPGRSLAFLLSDAGYDVWMSNARGNRYSREHVTLKTDTVRYWNFSWHEIATRDMPAIIDYIHQTNGPGTEVIYIGHSMGSTVLFALLSLKPEYNKKLKAGIALAPVVFMSDVRGPARELAAYSNNFGYVATLLGRKEFIPRQPGHGWLGSDACNTQRLDSDTCKHFVFILCGFDNDQLDPSMLPVFLAHIGSGTSVKTVVHFSQEISSNGRFQMFDYGVVQNNKVYGTSAPPEYNLDGVAIPVVLFSSQNDPLSSEKDVRKLHDSLKGEKKMYTVPFNKFNHLDFLWAKEIKKLLHDKLFEVLNEFNS